MTHEAMELVRKFYPPEGMFLKEIQDFSVSTSSAVGKFTVPIEAAYSIVPLNYVTAEQYVRCFSQLSYGLIYLLSIYSDGVAIFGGPADFERLMFDGKMWYRRMDIRFIKSTKKGEKFELGLELTKIRRVGKFAVASLHTKGSVVVRSEFVVPL